MSQRQLGSQFWTVDIGAKVTRDSRTALGWQDQPPSIGKCAGCGGSRIKPWDDRFSTTIALKSSLNSRYARTGQNRKVEACSSKPDLQRTWDTVATTHDQNIYESAVDSFWQINQESHLNNLRNRYHTLSKLAANIWIPINP